MSEEIIAEVPKVPSAVDIELDICEKKIARLRKKMEWIEAHRAMLEANPGWNSFGEEYIDFDNLSHKQIVSVIRSVGGKWEKKPHGADRITYTNYKAGDGVVVRCYNGEPPPSCRVVEVEEHVPAIPARVVKVRKIVCAPTLSAAIAVAAESVQKGDQP